jgi:hypothetical protein
VGRGLESNKGMFLLLTLFYCGAVFSGLRVGMGTLGEWKLHMLGIMGFFGGLFLVENPKFTRLALYAAGIIMLLHSLTANAYVSETGLDMRYALADMSGMLGHTDYWTGFTILTLLILGQLIEERNKIVKYIGFLMTIYFYKTILLCGFATPVAVFFGCHIITGFVYLKFGKKGLSQLVVRISLATVLILGSVWGVYKIAGLDNDSRYSSIQLRFKNMLDNPEGGGYDVENSRLDIAKISIQTFKTFPMFGCGGVYFNNQKTGGHHALVDFLAIYGLFGGGGAFVCFLFLCLINCYRRCKNEKKMGAFVSFASIGIFIFLGLVNPGWIGGVFYTLLLYAQPFKRAPRFSRFCEQDVAKRYPGSHPFLKEKRG